MAYVRKTKDEYIIQGNYGYGQGFEDECTRDLPLDCQAG